ncbi:MAG: RNA polymerase factor sigma-54 [Candidatus Scalindua sp.]|nr:RNA polymerase factor sigma-54 [Candidatus Scalindua sp.]
MRTTLSPQLRQQTKMSPQMFQSLEILQLPMLELVAHVQQELIDNPLLEDEKDFDENEQEENEKEPMENEFNDKEKQEEDKFKMLGEMIDEWNDYDSLTSRKRSDAIAERDRKHEALENTPEKTISFGDYLSGQLSVMEIEGSLLEICENIIYHINDSGYLACHLGEIMEAIKDLVSQELANEALEIIQSLEPVGVGARDLKECLILQLDKRNTDYNIANEIISNYLEDVEKEKCTSIAKKFGYNLEWIKNVIAFIKTLNPKPGSLFSNEQLPYITPDARVDCVEGKYEVTLVGDNNLPRIYISTSYRDVLNGNGGDLQTKRYIRKKIESAKWLIDSIEQRRSTLYKVSLKIVEMQKGFLEEGVLSLRTLKMKDVADALGIHASTVSRATAHKYMQPPKGIFEMKYFFTGGFKNADGNIESWEATKEKVAKIIKEEDKSNPLNDEEIAAKLREMGSRVARRTVAKYRESMKISSSRKRRSNVISFSQACDTNITNYG